MSDGDDSATGGQVAKKVEEYRRFLQEAEQKAQAAYDKTVLALSGGALGISFAFVKDIVELEQATDRGILVVAWIAWGLSLAAVLVSLFTNVLAMRKAVDQIDEQTIYVEHPGGWLDLMTLVLNVLSGFLFLLGLGLLVVFVVVNHP